jgi:ferritin
LIQLISDILDKSLCEQIGHEKYNSNLYLYIAAFFNNMGLTNLGKKFEEQHEEEFGHSKMIYNILIDLSAPVYIPEIDQIDVKFGSILDIAKLFLDREIATTESLDAIKHLAMDEDCPVVEEAMRDMIKLQRNEYAEATDFVDKAQLTGGDWSKVMIWDLSLKD